jgi:soluble lytic murein transglycosylase-like protein
MAAQEHLSNLTFREQVGISQPAIADISSSIQTLVPSKEGSKDVKTQEVSVKTTAPMPPKTPDVLFGHWKTEKLELPPIKLGQVDIQEVILTAGKYHGIDPQLSMAVAKAESSLDSQAVSKDGHHSKGLFQLLDSTGQEMMKHLGVKDDYQPFDPAQNSYLGVGYLRRLHDMFSESTTLSRNLTTHPASSAADLEKLAVAAFNAGQGNVARAQEAAKSAGKNPELFSSVEPHLPAQTRAYVGRVMDFRQAATQGSGPNTKV